MPKAARSKPNETPPITAPHLPEVIVDFIFENGLLFVALQNIGDRPTYDVRVTFDRPFHGVGGEEDVSALRMFKCTPFLGPHRSIRTFLDTTTAYFDRDEPTSIIAKVTYKDAEQQDCAHTIKHDLAIYRDISFVSETAPASIVV